MVLTFSIVLMLSVVMLIFTSLTASAAIISQGYCGTNVMWYFSDDGVLTIEGSSGIMDDYSTDSRPTWDEYSDEITKLIIRGSVSNIGEYAFYNCTALKLVTISAPVTHIGQGAFAICSALTDISLPDTVNSIDSYAFSHCTSLTHFTVPEAVSTLSGYTWFGSKNIEHLTLNENIKTIQLPAFSGMSSLKTIDGLDNNKNFKVSSGILFNTEGTAIYHGGAVSGEYYFIPSTVTSIRTNAFINPDITTTIFVPETVTTINSNAFDPAVPVAGYTGSIIDDYAEANSLNYTNYAYKCGSYAYARIVTEIIKPAGRITALEILGNSATYDYEYSPRTGTTVPWNALLETVSAVRLKGNIINLGEYLFAGMTNLRSVQFNSTPRNATISSYAFAGCGSLTAISLPLNWYYIEPYAFTACTALNTVDLGSVLSVGTKAFNGSAITTVSIPSTCILADGAFSGCSLLEAVNADAMHQTYHSEDGVLFKTKTKELFVYPVGKTTATYIVPDTTATIGPDCYGSNNLKYVLIPEAVTAIDKNAFASCRELTIYGYTGSAAEAFAADNNMSFIPLNGTVPPNVALRWEFNYHTKTLTITGTGSIFDAASIPLPWEYWISDIETVVINDGLLYLGAYAFGDAEKLTEVHLPLSIAYIYENAFANTPSLEDVYYAGALDDWLEINLYPLGNETLTGARRHYGITRSINSVAVSGDYIFVSTSNIEDGRKIMLTAYSEDDIYLGLHYIEITNNIGQLNVSTEGWGKVKAFVIDFETMLPVYNAVSATVQ